ncbi:hypothetical protein IT415_02585 [bacterium]|nr:hypothetical protein [bacterium]
MSLATWSLTRKLQVRLTRLEKIATTIVLSVAFSSWLSFMLWYVLGKQIGTGLLALIALLISFRDHTWYQQFFRSLKVQQVRQYAQYHRAKILIAATCTIAIAVLAYNYAFPIKDGAWYSSGPSWGDTVLHTSLASYFVENGVRELVLPVYPQASLSYPFLIDLHLAQLFYITGSWQVALFWPTFILLLSLLIGSYRIGMRITHARAGGIMWSILLFFNGSAGGLMLLINHLTTELPNQLIDYTNAGIANPSTQLFFNNITTSELLPQRTHLIGINVVFIVLLLLLSAYKRPDTKLQIATERSVLYSIAVIVGLLPLLHVHSFFVVGLSLIIVMLVRWWQSKHIPLFWIRAAVLSLAIAAPQLYWQFSSSFSSSFSRWHVGWMAEQGTNILWFWFLNLGILLPAIAYGIWLATKRVRNNGWALLLASVGGTLFIACNVYVFQPYIWDNMKFITYGYLFLLLPLCCTLVVLWQRGRVARVIISLVGVMVIIPGVLSIARQYIVWDRLFSTDDITVANYVRENTEPDDLFLTPSRHNMPVTAIAGRKTLLGYEGWLWTYNIDYSHTKEVTQKIWRGDPAAQNLLKDYGVDYIAISEDQALEANISIDSLNKAYDQVYSSNGWYIFRTYNLTQ